MIANDIILINCYPGELNVSTCWDTWGRVSQCMPRVEISDPLEIEWAWSYKQTCYEWGITAQTFGCMHMIFLPKEHDITKASHCDVGIDVVVTWDAMHDIIIKKI